MITTDQKDIVIEINGVDMDATVFFDYQPEEKATHDEPGCPEEITIEKLTIAYHRDYSKLRQHVDVTWMVEVEDISKTILEAIKDRSDEF
jgi:hypothetical protein